MPLYEYQCEACQKRFEVIRKFSDPVLAVCTQCGKGPIQRLQSSPAIQFKGSGWYITDYAKKSAGSDSGGSSTTGDSKPATSDTTTKSDTGTKSETTTPAAKPATSD